MRHLLVTVLGVVLWPLLMLVALGRAGEWQAGNAIVGGMFHVAMWAGIAYWAGWL